MTIQLIQQPSSAVLKVRYFPLAAWLFVLMALYGLGSLVAGAVSGSLPFTGGTAMAMLILAGFTLFITIFSGPYVVCAFDRGSDRVRLQRYGLLGRSVVERPLSEVTGLEILVLRRAQHRLALRLASGEQLPLTPYYVVTLGQRSLHRLIAYLGVTPSVIEERARGAEK